MSSYEVIMTPDATEDLIKLKNYISDVLLAPQTALKYIRLIRKEIEGLCEFPERIKLVDDEPWRSKGLRKTKYKNFFIYFRIDESVKRVYILNIIYARRDQLKLLK